MVSVIIPAYNAEKTIDKCLSALTEQSYEGDYEVIVVDDGSSDATADIASKFKNVKTVKQRNAGPAAARNKGAEIAKGDIVLFTDADCIPERDWISQMIKPFSESADVTGVKGAYRTMQKEIAARFVQCEYEDKYARMMKNHYIDFIDTYSAGFKKDVFLEMNGYDTSFPVACAEDVELSYRMANRGYKMVFNPEAIVYHMHPDSLSAYLKKKYKFAFWRVVALKNNPNKIIKDSHTPQIMKLQLLFPPLILSSMILSGIWGRGIAYSTALFFLFFVTTFPFSLCAIKKDFYIGALAPLFLFLRATAQFLGVMAGIIYTLSIAKHS